MAPRYQIEVQQLYLIPIRNKNSSQSWTNFRGQNWSRRLSNLVYKIHCTTFGFIMDPGDRIALPRQFRELLLVDRLLVYILKPWDAPSIAFRRCFWVWLAWFHHYRSPRRPEISYSSALRPIDIIERVSESAGRPGPFPKYSQCSLLLIAL